MTAADKIAELERQRAEQHRVVDQTYDARIGTLRLNCAHQWADYASPFTGRITKSCLLCGELESNLYTKST